MNDHRRKQWADVTVKTLLVWLAIFILLSIIGAEASWAAYISGFISLFLFFSMSYLNKDNLLTDEEVLSILENTKST
ncbi:MAG TPA: hypothetical protein PKC11_08950 [Agitococcus sp.]|nr:hypothetical protein [Agitococcus sp.]HMX99879.1 hypothetical protein [Agitococcus sp.]